VIRFPARILPLLVLAALPAPAQNSTRLSTDVPIVNFRLPNFTADGHRAWLVRGSEARMTNADEIDIKELTMSIFAPDGTDHIETILLSPQARVTPKEQVASDPGPIRVINDNFEATGIGWHYDHKTKIVSISRHVRVILHSELKDLLK